MTATEVLTIEFSMGLDGVKSWAYDMHSGPGLDSTLVTTNDNINLVNRL